MRIEVQQNAGTAVLKLIELDISEPEQNEQHFFQTTISVILLRDESLLDLYKQLDLWPLLRNRYVIDHGRWIPVRIQVVLSSLEWTRNRPELVQVRRKVLRIGS